jgi:hypothetical protein
MGKYLEAINCERTLKTLNHSDRWVLKPNREPKEVGAFALSLIFPMTGSSTRNTLSSCGRIRTKRLPVARMTHSFFLHVDHQGAPSKGSDAEEMDILGPVEFLWRLREIDVVRRRRY